jgi:O-antigen biosynthesis protein WbqV
MKNIHFEKILNMIVAKTSYVFHNRSALALMHDLVVVVLSIQASLFLRLGGDLSHLSTQAIALNTAIYVLFATAIFLGKRVYKGMWRYASLGDLISIAVSVTYITLLYVSVMFLLPQHFSLPRSTPLINWFVLVAFLGSPRLFYRLYRQRRNRLPSRQTKKSKRALVVGYGDQTELFIREILRQGDDTYELLGLVGSNAIHVGQQIHHVSVVGTITEIPTLVRRFGEQETPVELLIVADETLDSTVLKSLTSLAETLDLRLARLPRISEITDPTTTPQVQPIEIEDLLGRPQASLDRESMRAMIKGKRVLVTGAGGTIGGELVRQISDFGPSHLCLVDHSEYLLYATNLELSERHPSLSSENVLADVACRERIHRVFSSFKPELVFHAAALKHVPLVESNPSEGCITNVIGTRNVADACRKFGVRAMLLISTDKAINPTSVMGATKRLAECYCQALDILEQQKPQGTRYISVRFGNVLGSSGSVVPLFKRQIEKGGPLTLTHPDMTRYFMTVHEAVELVLQATTLALHANVQSGRVFVLNMGEPVKILDLAKQMIQLAGLKLDVDISIKYVGLRPGEKLFENLFHDSEHLIPTSNANILLGAPRTLDYGFLIRALHELETLSNNQNDEAIKRLLHTLVPEYKTPDQGKVSNDYPIARSS